MLRDLGDRGPCLVPAIHYEHSIYCKSEQPFLPHSLVPRLFYHTMKVGALELGIVMQGSQFQPHAGVDR